MGPYAIWTIEMTKLGVDQIVREWAYWLKNFMFVEIDKLTWIGWILQAGIGFIGSAGSKLPHGMVQDASRCGVYLHLTASSNRSRKIRA